MWKSSDTLSRNGLWARPGLSLPFFDVISMYRHCSRAGASTHMAGAHRGLAVGLLLSATCLPVGPWAANEHAG